MNKELVKQVWQKAIFRPGLPLLPLGSWAYDAEGNIIRFGDYGKLSKYGWEIDHIKPKAQGGSDHLSNLRPLHWKANREKGDLM